MYVYIYIYITYIYIYIYVVCSLSLIRYISSATLAILTPTNTFIAAIALLELYRYIDSGPGCLLPCPGVSAHAGEALLALRAAARVWHGRG